METPEEKKAREAEILKINQGLVDKHYALQQVKKHPQKVEHREDKYTTPVFVVIPPPTS